MRSGRQREPRIHHLETHPRQAVCLRVAAIYLGLSERTLRARIEAGHLPAIRDGKVYRITVAALHHYQQTRCSTSNA